MENGERHIEVRNMDVAYGDFVILRDVSFDVRRGEILMIMGESGSGKSTLLRQMIGLHEPARGEVLYDDVDYWSMRPHEQRRLMRRFGVLYQGGALWGSMTLRENVALVLEQYTDLARREIDEVVELKLALVGLRGFEDSYPAEISGGMRKRASLARAIALDPDILFFDEPSAGLDPINARRLDDLMLQLRDGLGATAIVVTHELDTIFSIGDNSVFLDVEEKTITARGNPKELRRDAPNPRVRQFLNRGRK
jgi:phospholipid/cholesterol/gamma-HCH transport system ATP-binding protein